MTTGLPKQKLLFIKDAFFIFPKADFLLVALFFVFLFIPMLNINTSEMAQSKKENRMLAKYVPLFGNDGINLNYGKDFETWFSDRFWGRERAIKSLTKLRNKILFSNGNTAVFVGEDGWLYTKRFNSIAMFQNTNLFSDDELNRITENMQKILNKGQQINAKIYLVLSNDKESIYPEFYPKEVKKVGKISRRDQLISHLKTKLPNLRIVSSTQNLIDHKNSGKTVFCKTGTHMNNTGSWIEYQTLMQEISKDFSKVKPYQISNINIESKYECDEDLLSSIEIENYDKNHLLNDVYTIKSPKACQVDKYNHDNDTDSLTEVFKNKQAKSPYKVLLMGDSFANRYKTYLAETFSEFCNIYISSGRGFIWNNKELEYIKTTKPNIIVFATTERFLSRLLTIELP